MDTGMNLVALFTAGKHVRRPVLEGRGEFGSLENKEPKHPFKSEIEFLIE